MRTIHKKISLEQFKSRFPIAYPSYDNGNLSFIDSVTIRRHPNGNYGCIPVNLTNLLYIAFSPNLWPQGFKTIYGSSCNNDGKSLSYYTFHNIYLGFKNYYDLIYYKTCNYPFSSATDYFDNVIISNNTDKKETSDVKNQIYPNRKDYIELDNLYGDNGEKLYGGSGFYKWLTEWIFFNLDLRGKYIAANATYDEWNDYLDYWETTELSYPDAREWLSWFKARSEKYSAYTKTYQCSAKTSCCDCVEYVSRGGLKMERVISSWVKTIEAHITTINGIVKHNLSGFTSTDIASKYPYMPSFTITLPITKSLDNIGNYSTFSNEWQGGEDYSKSRSLLGIKNMINASDKHSTVVTYNDDSYIFNGAGKGYGIDAYSAFTFADSSWDKYTTDAYINKNVDGYSGYTSGRTSFSGCDTIQSFITDDGLISGVTESRLELMKIGTPSYDNMVNELPGYYDYASHSASTYSQPAEGELLDLYYQIGNTAELSPLSGDTTVNNLYFGDILTEMNFYYTDTEGNMIIDTQVHLKDKKMSVLSAITRCEMKKENWENKDISAKTQYSYSANTVNDKMSCDVYYYVGAYLQQTATYDKAKNTYTYSDMTFLMNDGKEVNKGIKFKDSVHLSLSTGLYYLNQDEYYQIRYYNVERDETIVTLSSYLDTPTTSYLAEFSMDRLAYEGNKNNTILTPIFRREYDIGYSMPQKLENNIYIDRGYSSALDQHLKLEEVTSVETLENYGNGSFKIRKDS
jgi:hypothetical protein